MKQIVLLFAIFFSLVTNAQSYKTITCGACNGNCIVACYGCMGQGVTISYVMDYNGYFWPTQVTCNYCSGTGATTCVGCKGKGTIRVPNSTGGYNYPSNGYNYGNSSSNNSSGYTCSGCGGTGVCTACGGSGKQRSTAYYTDGHTIESDCPTCRGSRKCGVCHGKGSI